jgi:exodeoxyribonuclease VII large subunit
MDSTTYSVAELSRAVGRAVSRAFPDEVWVQGEIRDLSRPASGHVYFTLLDADSDEEPAAVLPVTLFESDKVAVNRVLSRSGAVRMTGGVQVRIRGRVTHYPQRGTVQLRMTWIDTDFTLGKLAAERDRLIKSLSSRGLLEKNRALPVPLVPLRVGLITSLRSAAHADFLNELGSSGYAWQVTDCDARVQGDGAVGDIVRGLEKLGTMELDVIALVRGGGAQTDLAVFDAEEIAVGIAHSPIPVLTGIGHEIDTSVADLVARSYKTPTACAANLVGRIATYLGRVDQVAVATRSAVRSRLEVATARLDDSARRMARSAVSAGTRAGQRLDGTGDRIRRGSRQLLSREHSTLHGVGMRIGRVSIRLAAGARLELDRMAAAVTVAAQRRIAAEARRVDELEHGIGLVDPTRLLARGWSITRDGDGGLVVDPAQAPPGTVLRTTVAGGGIDSVVTERGEATDG